MRFLETEYLSYGMVDKKKGAQYWDSTDEDRNLSVRLSEKRGVLKERVPNVTYREDIRAFQSKKEVIEAGIVAQKCGEDEDDIEMEPEGPESPQQCGYLVRSQHNAFQGAMASYERHYKSIHNEALTEVFETPREEIENTERVNYPYPHPYGTTDRNLSVIHDATSTRQKNKIFSGSKTDRSVPRKDVVPEQASHLRYTTRRVQPPQEDEVQKTVSTVYEDAFSCSLHYGKKPCETTERVETDTNMKTQGYESARSIPPRSHRTPGSARRQKYDSNKSFVKEQSYSPMRTHERNFQEIEEKNSARSRSKDDAAKLLSGLYHTCQSVVPAEPVEVSPGREKPDFEREGSMRSSFYGEDRKLFVSEILKNIQMKNQREKESLQKGHHRENAWIAKAERETASQSKEEQRRESVQRDVQKLMESAFKPRNSMLHSYLRRSRVDSKVGSRDWKENMERKSEYSHPFDEPRRDSYRESVQQEQREEPRKSVNDTPGFKNEGALNKSWESYSVQERKDMLLTKRFMDVPVNGFENK